MDVLRYMCAFFMVISTVRSYRILGLFCYPGKSHFEVSIPIMKQLAVVGHNITVVSPFTLTQPQERYTDLSFHEVLPLNKEEHPANNMNSIHSRILASYLTPFLSDNSVDGFCKLAFESKAVQKLLESAEKFDLVITEMFVTDCLLAINQKYNVPVIGFVSSIMLPWNAARFGVPDTPSYIPTLFLDYSQQMSFFGRLENTLVSLAHKFWFVMRNKRDDEIAAKYLNGVSRSASRFADNASLLLVNSHHSLNGPRPFPPNVIEIGGVHIGKSKQLPAIKNSKIVGNISHHNFQRYPLTLSYNSRKRESRE
ncbi:hypothetical protein HHI36_010523 [Cryptolaemus montrouzieri]|uniref:Uncharacterized protein n=1 Tax=Cryptolaemus montrouzieri TaxID=559131 RepID=A0ABD2MIX8_9CUCU